MPGTTFAWFNHMKIKNLFALTTVLGAAALLQNKQRRDKFLTTAKDLIGSARNRLGATHATEPSMATPSAGTAAGY